jgi:hypothetical protein
VSEDEMPAASVRAIGYSVRLPVTTPAALARSLAREARDADSCDEEERPGYADDAREYAEDDREVTRA